jgi:ABC-type glycerol-3-phosphate transport system substrate-binding protein
MRKSGTWEVQHRSGRRDLTRCRPGPAAWLVTNAYAMRHWIRHRLPEKYEAATGKGMPTTTDEYFDYMIWCRDNDPNGNGQKDEISWSGSEKRTVWYARPTDFLMHAFTWNTRDGYYLRDDKIHANFVEDDYREGLKFLNKMMVRPDDENYHDNDKTDHDPVALNDGYTVASVPGGMHNAAPTITSANMISS